ncbi:MAG: hypothetical protein U0U67_11025 [Chitinophagales bacterium]
MKKVNALFIVALVYWFFSCGSLYTIMHGHGESLPFGLDILFFPGCILGFAFGYGGGNVFAILGQLITLLFILIVYFIAYRTKKKDNSDIK